MRTALLSLLLVQAFSLLGCGRSTSNGFALQDKKVERVEDCHVYMDSWNAAEEPRWAGLMFACNVPETAQNQTEWWGNQPHPFAFNMRIGECLLLAEKFYCLETIEPGKATFKAGYQWANKHHDRIKPLP